ncbi:hypothetical protein RRG08_021152 [Elysia crispata]|uniref:PiggyBac transposable element-derived protein domain-containing protein n=1 Tax=Elysia crispata TaxID=231223 RepID=A0AAE0Z635_9GAST|nr:hypothetical protein RRG08_021152 [Elysia crispata]
MNEETLSDVDLEDVSSDESEFEGYSSSNNSEDENEVGNIDLGANPWVRTYPPEDEADPAFSFDETVGPKNCPPPASPLISGKRDRPEAGDGRGLAHRVVVTLLQMGNYLRKGYHVFIDNFFTSVALLKELYNSKTYATGTVRQNSKGLPKLIKNKLEPNESAFFRQDFLLATSYREKKPQKKPVLLLSSKSVADVTEVEIRQRGGGDGDRVVRRKPNVVLDYNKSMGEWTSQI